MAHRLLLLSLLALAEDALGGRLVACRTVRRRLHRSTGKASSGNFFMDILPERRLGDAQRRLAAVDALEEAPAELRDGGIARVGGEIGGDLSLSSLRHAGVLAE